MKDDYIYGKHAVLAMLAEHPKKVTKLYIKDTLSADVAGEFMALAKKYAIPYIQMNESWFRMNMPDVNHQGLALTATEIGYAELGTFLESIKDVTNPLVVLLDELEDPGNVGAIIRSACAFGVSGILMPKHRQVGVTGAVMKASVGTAARIPIVRIGNVNDTIKKLKDEKFWIVALDMDGEKNVGEYEFDTPTCLVIGAEGEGVRAKTLENADFRLRIPMGNNVESLNASVSAAIAMYSWKIQQK